MISFFIQNFLFVLAILLIASLSGMMSERAGIVNISIEGMMTTGALGFAIISSFSGTNNATQLLGIIIAMICSGLIALLHAYASVTLKADQTIVGTAINLLASGIALFVCTLGAFGDSASYIAGTFKAITFGVNGVMSLYIILAIVLLIIIIVFFNFTKIGMRYAAVGENPNAIDAAGISVIKYRYIALFISGLLAGLAGAIYVVTLSPLAFYGDVRGFGFLALAIMICGQWRPTYIFLVSILFALLFSLATYITNFTDNSWIKNNLILFKILPFIGSLLVMIIFSKRSKMPKADGIPFDKSLR
ncbi:ABC transporter permease [Spiroplasma endosymbiont of Labia minor]|uniref:ABC transporter permease n=1 Tax=Spiroplasma endosymbiont of Labia minor TaxID=3066305 RepID=UPI0030CDF85A